MENIRVYTQEYGTGASWNIPVSNDFNAKQHARGMTINNYSDGWIYSVDRNAHIPPRTVGFTLQLEGIIPMLSFQWKAPAGVDQPTIIPTATVSITVTSLATSDGSGAFDGAAPENSGFIGNFPVKYQVDGYGNPAGCFNFIPMTPYNSYIFYWSIPQDINPPGTPAVFVTFGTGLLSSSSWATGLLTIYNQFPMIPVVPLVNDWMFTNGNFKLDNTWVELPSTLQNPIVAGSVQGTFIGIPPTSSYVFTYSAYNPSGSNPLEFCTGSDQRIWAIVSGPAGVNNVYALDTVSNTWTTYSSGTTYGVEQINHGSDGRIWYLEYGGGHVLSAIDTLGTVTSYNAIGGTGICTGYDGNTYVGNGGVLQVSPTGSLLNTFVDGSLGGNPASLVQHTDGKIWGTDNINSQIFSMTTTGAFTLYTHALHTTLSNPKYIVSNPVNGCTYWINGGTNTIGKCTSSGTITAISTADITSPAGITVSQDGRVWITNNGVPSLAYIKLDDTTVSVTDASIANPLYMAIGPNGNPYFQNDTHMGTLDLGFPQINDIVGTVAIYGLKT